ncbi:aminotransferase class IV family protein [Paracoccus tibetensis]|uniref:Probable branched-chain-amino-acid aminotransferase n=1 Tax=Paracoccus tibetensis TaxID=336292 RepID=A0A1G5DGQ6_9RHOB|nr:aminotransferase class IV family protein [Paracoccus tibetensis]SCY13806.1 4-amino-4-deoxychorismate lyase [Paracoccus tibetensis]
MQGRIPGPYPPDLTVFETMRAEADRSIRLWPLHLARLRRGCAAVGFSLDETAVAQALASLPRGRPLRARLAIDAAGAVALTQAPLPPSPPVWRVVISDERLRSDDPWLGIKSSQRAVYDRARARLKPGADEALLLNERGELCEGTITSLFVAERGLLLTPPLSSGLLPGVLRESLLAAGRAREAVLSPADLAGREVFCGNALRGLIPAQLG